MPRILVTREVDAFSARYARQLGIDLVVDPVIKIEFLPHTPEMIEEIVNSRYDAIAFTSQNAVKAFSEIIWEEKIRVPKVKFFAIGDSTARHLNLLEVKPLVPKINDAVALAELILSHPEVKTLLFPCAEHHLEDLPEWLKRHQVAVKELILYSTIQLLRKIPLAGIEGIVFMSPSAVKSFFQANRTDTLPCFCIGRTTAEEVMRWTSAPIMIARQPDMESIFDKVAEYWSTTSQQLV
ncbi:MAG: hypothetical protein KatS3mg031_0688 [Chitinophagales bacterium]|nr:MAG: hypothetical protein KatS3mg031_0688 [Chitinophagales bacterium]